MFHRRRAIWITTLLVAAALAGSAACGSGSGGTKLPEWQSVAQPPCAAEPGEQSNACIVIDADPAAPGLQPERAIGRVGESFEVDILLEGMSAAGTMNAFDVSIRYSRAWLVAAAPEPAPEIAEQVAADAWTCQPLVTNPASSSPQGASAVYCRARMGSSPGSPLRGSRKLATIRFTAVAIGASRLLLDAAAGNITSTDGSAGIDSAAAACQLPNRYVGGGCLNATAKASGAPAMSHELTLRSAECLIDDDGISCAGRMRNVAPLELDDVIVNIFFYLADGTPYGAAAALRSVPLASGESATFEVALPLDVEPPELYWRISFAYASSVRELLWRDER